ncbi:para-nitrobenzyl esterase [Colletotrichum chrysophilum]|uniref:Para-nitrobenzyl esterase n=1 Tax=Colletotrichum chrysophilum TaxID=1836956 RepID=A0AAD9AEJ0_9PEZI|nr:para-nitrobenzyl esterase [Colletotrichum chrysophilum]
MEIPGFEKPPMSDLHGLNLNVTLPVEGGHKLPVVVYVHGGGFVFGSGSYSHYDQSKVVELSSIMNQPIISVNIKYVSERFSMKIIAETQTPAIVWV